MVKVVSEVGRKYKKGLMSLYARADTVVVSALNCYQDSIPESPNSYGLGQEVLCHSLPLIP